MTQYVNKSKDASAKAELDTIMKAGAIYFEANSNYNNFCLSSGEVISVGSALSKNGYSLVCQCDGLNGGDGDCTSGTNQNFCLDVLLKTGKHYCVDTSGQKTEEEHYGCDLGGCGAI